MKRSFLTTSAVVAALAFAYAAPAQAQQAPAAPRAPGGMPGAGVVKLGVGGFMEQTFGYADNKESVTGGINNVMQQSETEIWFKGFATLPNGLTIIADVQLEGNSLNGLNGNPNDQIDESYLTVRGTFGEVILGSENGVDNLMVIGHAGTWATDVGETITFTSDKWIGRPAGVGVTGAASPKEIQDVLISGVHVDNDSEKLTYVTPRFSGFQFGASYIPENIQDRSSVVPLTNYHDGWSLAANFEQPFEGGSFGIAGGYLTWDKPAGTASPDPESWIVAASVTFGNWKFAGAYSEQNDLRASTASVAGGYTTPGIAGASTTTSLDSQAWSFGARYNFGQYRASLGYIYKESEGTIATPGNDEFEVVKLAVATDIARGVKVMSNLYYGGYRDEAGLENDNAWAINAGIRLDF